jgi:hypothetical protein
MNELLNGFLKAAKDEEETLSIAEMLSTEEVFQWEVLVKAMDTIDILNVGRDLEKVMKTYQLDRWQEMSLLAYVKVLEMMIKRAKDFSSGASSELPIPQPDKEVSDIYKGSMFG